VDFAAEHDQRLDRVRDEAPSAGSFAFRGAAFRASDWGVAFFVVSGRFAIGVVAAAVVASAAGRRRRKRNAASPTAASTRKERGCPRAA